MNLKLAKKLRKMSHEMYLAQGEKPDAQPMIEIEKNRKQEFRNLGTKEEPKWQAVTIATGTLVSNPVTEHGIYRNMKKNFKRKSLVVA
jgi:hypothetical protein